MSEVLAIFIAAGVLFLAILVQVGIFWRGYGKMEKTQEYTYNSLLELKTSNGTSHKEIFDCQKETGATVSKIEGHLVALNGGVRNNKENIAVHSQIIEKNTRIIERLNSKEK